MDYFIEKNDKFKDEIDEIIKNETFNLKFKNKTYNFIDYLEISLFRKMITTISN